MLRTAGTLAGAALLVACAGIPAGGTPTSEIAIITAADWGGTPGTAPLQVQTVRQVTIHHQGLLWDAAGDVPAYLRRLQQWSRQSKGWSDIPYHFVIAPDGRVYAARTLDTAGDTNTEYDPRGHALVMLLGNFDEQTPSTAQWQSAVILSAALMRDHQLPLSALGTHRHYSQQTACPGANFSARFNEFRSDVGKRLVAR